MEREVRKIMPGRTDVIGCVEITFDKRYVIRHTEYDRNDPRPKLRTYYAVRCFDEKLNLTIGSWFIDTTDGVQNIGWDISAIRQLTGTPDTPYWIHNDPIPNYVWFELFMRILGEVKVDN